MQVIAIAVGWNGIKIIGEGTGRTGNQKKKKKELETSGRILTIQITALLKIGQNV